MEIGSVWRETVRPDVRITDLVEADGDLVVHFETIPAQSRGTARVATFLRHYAPKGETR